MKRFLSFMMAMVMLASVVCFTGISQVFAAEIIPVYLNGELLTFPSSDAQPQIYNSRTYVPIRVTAEFLGMDISWNSKTETMTFTRDGVTIDHTMRSNIVYVDGEARTYDTPSINVQNRTLMPIRMLGDSIGATVDWDNDKRCVYITTDGSSSNADVSDLEVTSLVLSTNSVSPGDRIKLTATAVNAEKVKFVDNSTGAILAEVDEYGEDDDGVRTFETYIYAENETSSTVITTVYAYAGNDSGYNEDLSKIKQSVFVINPDDEDDDDDDDDDDGYESEYLISYDIDSTKYEKGEYAYLTIVTTDDVSRVRVTNSYTTTKAEATTYDEDDDERTFEVKTRMNTKGSGELYIYLYVDGSGYEDCYETIDVKVTDDDDDDDETYDELEIVEIEVIDDIVYKGEETTVIVYTSTDTEEVVIYDEDDEKVARNLYYTGKSDGMLVWHMTFEVNHSGKEKYTCKIYNEDNDEESETFRIEGESYSKSDLVVVSVTQKSDDVNEGDSCKFEAKTTSSADYIKVTTNNGKELDEVTSSTKSSSFRKFTFTIDVDDIDDYYYVYAYTDDGDTASKRFKVIGEVGDEVSIEEVEIEDKTVDEGDDIEVTVYTTTNVEKLWIEDDDGERVIRKTKPTDETSTQYIWELSFEAEEDGRRTYTIYVEDDDDNTDEYDFRITVK